MALSPYFTDEELISQLRLQFDYDDMWDIDFTTIFQSIEEEDDFFSHLMDEIEYFVVLDDKSILVYIRNENYEKRCEELYPEEYVKKWDRLKPETRPWRFSIEIECGES